MTLERFERIVVLMANQCYVRFWRHWNYPDNTYQRMVISLRDHYGRPIIEREYLEKEMLEYGFERLFESKKCIGFWSIVRTNDDGTEYRNWGSKHPEKF